ncbi:MAG: UMP kinase [Armatimonadota bacterium]|nr:UMP kinase [Armatimonadota bacterium]MDR5697747.1 UMP kinase [Armatimonadota bacterium]
MLQARYQRIVLKISGEELSGPEPATLDPEVLRLIAREVRAVQELGTQIALVVGGGNIVRGAEFSRKLGIDKVTADYMGMLATVINALALQEVLESHGLQTRVQSAIAMHEIAEPFIRRRAVRHLEKGRVVLFAAGTGSPYFTTDTTAALRAIEIEAGAVLIAKNRVPGVFDKDPNRYADAVMFDRLTYLDYINRGLQVMDTTTVSLCMDNGLDIWVFNLQEPGNLARIVRGEHVGTLIGGVR